MKNEKKEWEVEGIECNKCLTSIKKNVNKLNGVNASIDYSHKTLNLEVNQFKDLGEVLDRVQNIANKHDHHILIKEKFIKNTVKKTLMIDKIDCANCAAKMERQINDIDGVVSATLDFMTKKLTIEAFDNESLSSIIEQAKTIVSNVDANSCVIDIEKKHLEEIEEKPIGYLKQYLTLGIGGLFFILGLIFKFPSYLEFAFFFISYLIVGGEVILKALRNILKGHIFDENFLMVIATVGAFFLKEYPEGVAVMLFYQIGELFQDIAVDKSRRSITKLMDIRPDYANLKIGDTLKKVSPNEVNAGDLIVVKAGEKIPLDGKIVEGESFVDTTALTGESVFREVSVGNEVYSGFINKNGLLTIKVSKSYGESAVKVILDLVENASSKKATTENFITKFARYYTPIVVICALLIAFVPTLFLGFDALKDWGYRALVFLVISCPCALVISIPLGFFGGIGGSSRLGILVKGSNYLEALNNVDTVVFDKTGTLTKGVFQVTEINPEKNYTKDEILKYAAYVESYSNHPIAESILKSFNQDINRSIITNYQEISGKGIKADIEGIQIICGNAKMMTSEKISFKKNDTYKTVVYLAIDKQYAGNIVISDEIKKDTKKAIQSLKKLGIKKTIMLTGDTKEVASTVGNSLGIDEVYSELLPNEKVGIFEEIQANKKTKGKMIFVGDGVNDAPVLARSDVGIAMGGLGSDAAIEAADIVIMNDEPSKISTSIKVARKTRKIVWQNIYFSLGVKFIVLILGALGAATMWEAVFADVGVSIIAILNAIRAMNIRPYKKK